MTDMNIETKDADPIETKDGGTIEVRFDAYHAETKAALEALEARHAGELAAEKQHVDEIEAKLNRLMLTGGGSNPETKAAAEIKREHSAFGRYAKSGDEVELKTLSAGSDPAGGYVVDTNLSRTINSKVFDQSPIRRLSRVISVASGDGWAEPRDMSDIGAEWAAESGSRTETTNPDFGMFEVPLNECFAHITLTQKLLDLNFVELGSYIESRIAEKFGRLEGAAYLSGNGVGKPRGILDYDKATTDDSSRAVDTLQYVVSGSAATVADADGQVNGLKNLTWSLRAPYRANAGWLMSSATAGSIDKLKDTNKNYVWKSSNTAGAPDELLGYPVYFDENMPSEGAGLYPVAFGDLRKAYTIVDWSGVKMLRDPYTSKPNVIIYAYRRTGGGLSNSEAIKLLKCST